MNATTKKTLAIVGGIIVVVAVTVFGALTVQVWQKQRALEQAPAVTAEAPPPEPAQPPAPTLAQVTAVKPHYVVTTKAVRECHPVSHTQYTQPEQTVPVAGAVIGGVAGGLAGSAVHGHDRDLAIGAGAVLGAVTGAAVQNNMNQPQPQTVESMHCQTHNVASKTRKGYEVTYLYNSQSSTILMDKAPAVGDMIPPPGQPVSTSQSTATTPPTNIPASNSQP